DRDRHSSPSILGGHHHWITRDGGTSTARLGAVIERPVFIVAPPRSGGTALFRSLARAPGMFSAPGALLEVFELIPENREWDSDPLPPTDLQPRVVEEIRGRLKGNPTDSAGNRPGIDATGVRWVDGVPKDALRVPFLAAIAPDSQFVYVHRDP